MDASTRVGRHFALGEFMHSPTAIEHGIANVPTEVELHNVRFLCAMVLDPWRDALGVPLVVHSGGRTPALNTIVGGVKDSQHVRWEAADVIVPGRDLIEAGKVLADRLPALGFDQLIVEGWNKETQKAKWLHVSCTSARRNRKQVLHTLDDGKGGLVKNADGTTLYVSGFPA